MAAVLRPFNCPSGLTLGAKILKLQTSKNEKLDKEIITTWGFAATMPRFLVVFAWLEAKNWKFPDLEMEITFQKSMQLNRSEPCLCGCYIDQTLHVCPVDVWFDAGVYFRSALHSSLI